MRGSSRSRCLRWHSRAGLKVRAPKAGGSRPKGIAVPPEQIEKVRKALEAAIEGEVRFSTGDRALYATDASNYRQIPYEVCAARLVRSAPCDRNIVRLADSRLAVVEPGCIDHLRGEAKKHGLSGLRTPAP